MSSQMKSWGIGTVCTVLVAIVAIWCAGFMPVSEHQEADNYSIICSGKVSDDGSVEAAALGIKLGTKANLTVRFNKDGKIKDWAISGKIAE